MFLINSLILFQVQSYLPVFNLWGAMGPLTPFWIKWPLVKARLGDIYHYVNGEILDSVLFSSEIECKWSHLKFSRLNSVCL